MEILKPEKWVANYADYLFAYAQKRVWDDDYSKNLVQETFLAGLESMKNFEGRSTERTWLTAILKNKILNFYRRKRELILPTADDRELNNNDFFENNGHWKKKYAPVEFVHEQQDLMERKEFNVILKLCMKKLPELWMSVFSMKFLDDEKSETICRELKITSSNYWVIVHRTKLNLRECLKNNGI